MKTALIIGGTGMLAEASRGLAARGYRLGLVARRAGAFAPELAGHIRADADWAEAGGFGRAVADVIARIAPVDLALVWTHDRPRGLALDIARALAQSGGAGRFYHVMGSAVSDPARPDALDNARAAFEAVLPGAWRPICLGFVVEGARSRWLTNPEISAGVLQAIDGNLAGHVIGQTRPWERKPQA